MNSLGPKAARAGPISAKTCQRASDRGDFAQTTLAP
jgi:hypothetical protein